VSIRVTDNGPGVADPRSLFQPLQKGADATGLGLYLSRAFLRSFRGELRHEPVESGCAFVIELALTPELSDEAPAEETHATHTIAAS
jgi:C4-dicarboxylate-specific signal transduction histidine kinase